MIFFPTFLITTQHNRESRWERITNLLENHEIEFAPILAPDYRLFLHIGLTDQQSKHQSLTMAYNQVCQTAIFMGLDNFIVVEDDLKILDMDTLYESLRQSNLPHDFDLCYLTKTTHNQSAITKAYNKHFRRIQSNWWETPITLWSQDFAKTFCQHMEQKTSVGLWLGHIDHELVQMNEKGAKMYGATYQTCIGLSNSPQNEMSLEGSITVSTS